jgi:hypothetical protein
VGAGERIVGVDDVIVIISSSVLFTGMLGWRWDVALRVFVLGASSRQSLESDLAGRKMSSSDGWVGEEERALDTADWKSIRRLTGSGVRGKVPPRGSWGDVVLDGDFVDLFFLGDGLPNVPSFGGVMREVLYSSDVECVCFRGVSGGANLRSLGETFVLEVRSIQSSCLAVVGLLDLFG